jgi:molybdopterin-biosynthesis enzyme MoeA-like protein
MGIGAIIIGEEIIRGKRDDKHFAKLIEILRARGMGLDWCQYLGDKPGLITAILRRTLASEDIVFGFGGIGATPDDHTRQCAADAAGVELALHPDAEAAIRSRTDMEITPQRLKMGEFPRGSRIVPNPYNRIPGFSLADHHFVPGFPIMAWSGCSTTIIRTCFTAHPKPRLRSSSTSCPNPPSRRSCSKSSRAISD